MFAIKDVPYGKADISMLKVDKDGLKHTVTELSVDVLLRGDLEESYLTDSNLKVIPTDTIKNTVYAVAYDHRMIDMESYGIKLARRFVDRYPHISSAHVTLTEQAWDRVLVSDGPHNHTFKHGGPETKIVNVMATRDKIEVETQLTNLIVLKTTQSGFTNFHKCEYTTLPSVADRSVKTNITAKWKYTREPSGGYGPTFHAIKKTLVDVFAGPAIEGVYSPSVQYTQYQIATAVLTKFPEVSEIFMSMPNLHNWSAGLSRIGFKDDGSVLVPAVNPNGIIQLTLTRNKSKL